MSEDQPIEYRIKQSLQSMQNFQQTKGFRLAVFNGNKYKITPIIRKVISHCQTVTVDVLKGNLYSPISKLLAIKLTKDMVETFNDEYISSVQYTVLPVMESIAMFQKGVRDEDRGKSYFQFQEGVEACIYYHMIQAAEHQQIGNSFFRLCLECIWVWSRWFPVDPDLKKLSVFKIAYERLVGQGVQFSQLKYFDVGEIYARLPETLTPVEMLKELQQVLKRDRDRQNPYQLKELFDRLTKSCRSGSFQGNLTSSRTYADYMHKLFHKIRKLHGTSKKGESLELIYSHGKQLFPTPCNKSAVISIKKLDTIFEEGVQSRSNQSSFANLDNHISHSKSQQQREIELHVSMNQHQDHKDNLLSEIQSHIQDKDFLNKEVSRLSNERSDYKKLLDQQKLECQKLRHQLEQEKHEKEQINQLMKYTDEDDVVAKNDTESSQQYQDLQRNLNRTELQLQRIQAQSNRHKQVVESHEIIIFEHVKHKQELEEELYKHMAEKEEFKGQAESHMQTIGRQQVAMKRIQEQHKEYQESNRQLRQENQESKQKYIQEVQELQSQLMLHLQDKHKLEQDLDHHKLKSQLSQHEIMMQKDNIQKSNDIHLKHQADKESLQRQNEDLIGEVMNLKKTQTLNFNKELPRFSKTGIPQRGNSQLPSPQQSRILNTQPKNFYNNNQQSQPVSYRAQQQDQDQFAEIQLIPLNLQVFQVNSKLITNKFTAACLKDKAVLYNDGIMQIGYTSTINVNKAGSDTVQVFFTNRTNLNLQQVVVNVFLPKGLKVTFDPLATSILDAKSQVILTFAITQTDIPYGQIVLQVSHGGMVSPQEVIVPYTINKLFKYQELEAELFPQQFSLVSEAFSLNQNCQNISQNFNQFTQFEPPDSEDVQLICAQIQIQGKGPVITIRIINHNNLGTVEIESGTHLQLGRFVLDTLVALLSQ